VRSPAVLSISAIAVSVGCFGCAALTRSATSGFADDLYRGIVNQDDVETVRVGAPAYLIALDGLIEGAPEDRDLLLSGARLYGAYASAFVEEPERAERMWDRALGYARRALCLDLPAVCDAVEGPFDRFADALGRVRRGSVSTLYGFGAAWAGWSQAHSDEMAVVADVPKVEALMERVVALDEDQDHGAAHLYLGVLYTQRPASLGGRPEEGRRHFERAVALSHGRNLMAKVYYARQYARLVFDRDLYVRLLREVVDADPKEPGLTLSNTLAQSQATTLLADADEYF
jgi:hypothetical protein